MQACATSTGCESGFSNGMGRGLEVGVGAQITVTGVRVATNGLHV